MALSAPHRLEEIYSMSVQLALRFDEAPITCETRAAVSLDFPLPGREAISGRTGGCARDLLQHRLPFWRYPDFQRLIQYQAPSDPQKLREEMVKLRQQGWTEKRIAQLLRCSRKTVVK
jgi:Homeodomain-like domain